METSTGATSLAAAVVLTAPVPQSLAMLDAGGVVLETDLRARLAALEYERCLAVLAVLEGPSVTLPPGGFAPAQEPIAWIGDNQLKGISAEPAITIHATPGFSTAHREEDRLTVGRALLDAAAHWIGAGIKTYQVHGWRFSKPLRVDAQWCAILTRNAPLVLAGDAFAGPRVEAAALSGWAATEARLTQSQKG